MQRLLSLLFLPAVLAGQVPASTPITLELRIDGREAGFTTFNEIAVSPDGGIVVPQRETGTLIFFDRLGRLAGSFGGLGDQPGAFRTITSFGWLGDTLWVHDNQLGRTTFVTPRLTLARIQDAFLDVVGTPEDSAKYPAIRTLHMGTAGAMSPVNFPTGLRVRPQAFYPDRSVLAEWYPPSTGPNPLYRGPADSMRFLLRTGPDGVAQRVGAMVPRVNLPECEFTYTRPNGSGSMVLPNCPRQLLAVARDGRRVLVVRQGLWWAPGSTAWFEVQSLGVEGDTLSTRRISYVAQAYPAGTLDSLVERQSAIVADSPEQLAAFRARPISRATAPVANVFVGTDGTNWMQVRSQWLALDAVTGATVAAISIPARSILVAADRTHLWFIEVPPGVPPSITRFRIGN